MGPFAMGDLAGIDVGWRVRQGTGAKAEISDALYEMGRYGQKTGKGYYLYEEGVARAASRPGGRRTDRRGIASGSASSAARSPRMRSSSA